MMSMRLEKLRQADLNLLVAFAAIAEEKSITAAASRLLLSQPAVGRALQRARAMFRDDLLVRSPNGFELTLRGRKILDELEGLLPGMENLVAPALFDPLLERSHFCISGPDDVLSGVSTSPFLQQVALTRYGRALHLLNQEEKNKLENEALMSVFHIAHRLTDDALSGGTQPPTIN
jgi:hypothetical protein